ncbi:hypothetical protein UCDDS831_g01500 [Diplodia seriata]|uniref:Uncharacterized protein n=1 Tax=Diplodia seriata TaxID=420778 RepID=A0A0G2HD32_9PEZI|nr:hypothetical protein UCDDS831_g01500 [Diplodia seriata]
MAAQPTAIGDHSASIGDQPATMPNPTEATTASGDKNQNNNTNRNRNIFRWADLPAELRNKIYELTLTATAPIAIEAVKIPGSDSLRLQHQRPEEPPFRPGHLLRRGTKFLGDVPAYNRHLTYHSAPTYTLGLAPALLLLNKTTYAEAGPILHANHLHFAQPVAFAVYIDRLSPTARALLKEITLGLELRARNETIFIGIPAPPRRAVDHDTYHAPTAGRARFWPPAFTALKDAVGLERVHLDPGRRNGAYDAERVANEVWMHAHHWLKTVVGRKGGQEEALELVDVKMGDPEGVGMPKNSPIFDYDAYKAEERTRVLREQLARWMRGDLTREMRDAMSAREVVGDWRLRE